MDKRFGAGFQMNTDGTVRLTDTQGTVIYETVIMGSVAEKNKELFGKNGWRGTNGFSERRSFAECQECGQVIDRRYQWCVEDRPYGFWTWLLCYTWIRTVREMWTRMDGLAD